MKSSVKSLSIGGPCYNPSKAFASINREKTKAEIFLCTEKRKLMKYLQNYMIMSKTNKKVLINLKFILENILGNSKSSS